MLPWSKSIANVVHVTVLVQPLLMCQTDEALDKLSTPYLDGSMGFVPTKDGFDHSDEWIWDSTFHKKSDPRLLMLAERCKYFEFGLMQSSMVQRPWLSKYISIISANSEVMLASFKTSMMVLIELWSWSTQPRSVHLVRCFEVSWLHQHCGHLLMMFSSQSKSLELQPHHPETCFAMNVRKVFGCLEIARLYPSHQTESNWADETIPLFTEKPFSGGPAPDFLQFGPQGACHLFLSHRNPDLLIWESTFDKLACAVGCLQGFLCKAIRLDVDLFFQQTVLPSLCVIGIWLYVFISNLEWLSSNKVFENAKNIGLWLVGRKWSERFVPMGNNPIVITINHDKRDCVMAFGCCCF
jgi:hypothetical protein